MPPPPERNSGTKVPPIFSGVTALLISIGCFGSSVKPDAAPNRLRTQLLTFENAATSRDEKKAR
jgi:hypothetical protein